jgi:hypothetical protein
MDFAGDFLPPLYVCKSETGRIHWVHTLRRSFIFAVFKNYFSLKMRFRAFHWEIAKILGYWRPPFLFDWLLEWSNV